MVLRVVQQRLDPRLSEAPRASIERLLLRPDDILRVRVAVEVLFELLPGEGVQLLNAGDGHVADVIVGAVLVQRGVDLACAKDDTRDLFLGLDVAARVRGVLDDPFEVRLASELVDARSGQGMSQQALREEENEG